MGLDFNDDGRAFAPLDFDQDGDLDLVRMSLTRLQLLENTLPRARRNFIRIELTATKSHASALGAEVTVTAAGVTQRDYVKMTAGFQTQVSRGLHFGLADVATIEELVVHWPSGAKQVFTSVAVNQALRITEGKKEFERIKSSTWAKKPSGAADTRMNLDRQVKSLNGELKSLRSSASLPTVINFWAPWCKPCEKELPVLARLSKDANYRFVGISVETEDLKSVKAGIAKYKLNYEQYIANPKLLESFFGTDSDAQLPSTFIFDEENRLRRAFLHRVGERELTAALSQLKPAGFNASLMLPLGEQAIAEGKLDQALEYLRRGLEETPEHPPLLTQLGWALSEKNQHDDALKTLKRATRLDPKFPYGWYALGVAYKRSGQLKAAVNPLKNALRFQPKVAKYWVTYGAVQSQLGDLAESQRAFEKVVEVEPSSIDGWLNLGKIKILRKQSNGAREFKEVLRFNPRHRAAGALLKKYGSQSPSK